MRLNTIFLFLLMFGISNNINGQEYKISDINPPFLKIVIPSSGFVPLDTIMNDLPCESIPDSLWQRKSAGPFDLMIAIDGPSGSGHYWNVVVGISDSSQYLPSRGVCFTTTTIGWRTLQSFKQLPLPWIDDRDKNGKPEIIIWDSFPVYKNATNVEYGMIAWVYEYNKNNEFNINWKITKEIAEEIASAYRGPNPSSLYKFLELRQIIAEQLEYFISNQILNK